MSSCPAVHEAYLRSRWPDTIRPLPSEGEQHFVVQDDGELQPMAVGSGIEQSGSGVRLVPDEDVGLDVGAFDLEFGDVAGCRDRSASNEERLISVLDVSRLCGRGWLDYRQLQARTCSLR